MRKTSVAAIALGFAITSSAFAQLNIFDVADLTTAPSTADPNDFDNNGLWLTMTSPTVTVISDDTFPGGPDGTYQLNTSDFYPDRTANILTQGLWANGNDVAVAGVGSQASAPAMFTFGETVSAASNYLGGGNNFIQLAGGPSDTYGNWNGYGRGAIGVVFPISGDLHYGFIDITMNPDETITLHGYAYEGTAGVGITTFAIPEPAMASVLLGLVALSGLIVRRRRR